MAAMNSRLCTNTKDEYAKILFEKANGLGLLCERGHVRSGLGAAVLLFNSARTLASTRERCNPRVTHCTVVIVVDGGRESGIPACTTFVGDDQETGGLCISESKYGSSSKLEVVVERRHKRQG